MRRTLRPQPLLTTDRPRLTPPLHRPHTDSQPLGDHRVVHVPGEVLRSLQPQPLPELSTPSGQPTALRVLHPTGVPRSARIGVKPGDITNSAAVVHLIVGLGENDRPLTGVDEILCCTDYESALVGSGW